MNVTLSIIIVNFETPDYTLGCIRSIYEHRPSCGFEILLIDNGSRDGSLDRIRAEMPEVVCIETGANLGFARANNVGILNARGNFILLLNSDTKILDNGLDRLLEELIADPSLGAAGPKQLDGKGKLQLSWGSFPTLVSEARRQALHYRLSLNDLRVREYLEEKTADSPEVDWVSGSCVLIRKEALTASGLLDGRFFMYFEDIDLCRRIQQRGWRIRYCSDITIVHYGGVSAKKNLLHVLVEYRRSQIYFARKYYGLKGMLVLKALLLAKYGGNFFRWAAAYLADRLFGKTPDASFAKLLLCKKTVELVFRLDHDFEELGVSHG